MKLERQNVPFTMIANEVLYRADLSLKAKGLFAYMFSKPEDWDFAADRIAKECREERKAVLRVLKELEDAGLLVRTKLPSGRVKVRLQYAAGADGEGTAPLFETAKAKVPKGDSGARVPKRHGGETVPVSNTEKESKKDVYIKPGSVAVVMGPEGPVSGGEINKLIEGFGPVNPSFARLFRNTTQRRAMERLVGQHGVEKVGKAVELAVKVSGMKFAPVITTPAQLEDRLGSLISFARKNSRQGPAVVKI